MKYVFEAISRSILLPPPPPGEGGGGARIMKETGIRVGKFELNP